jgi:hypothetical protein
VEFSPFIIHLETVSPLACLTYGNQWDLARPSWALVSHCLAKMSNLIVDFLQGLVKLTGTAGYQASRKMVGTGNLIELKSKRFQSRLKS